ncbi:MAG: gamma-glutamyl-gamma-aminobutyrate hydrolase family protein [Thermoanaerobaculia bacterium]
MRIALTLDRDASRREENDYVAALVGAGFRREEIVVLPPGSPIAGEFDGIVIGGGCDVDPARYGEPPRADARLDLDPERDETDFALFDRARRSQTPTLAICRGLQVVNVALGGTLIQDLPSQLPETLHHEPDEGKRKDKKRLDHPVRIEPGTRLSGIAAAAELPVNSRHHQAIARLAPDLTVSAVAPDGVIEAVEGGEPWLLAVQWHPENLAGGDAPSRRIFEEFARAVRARAVAAGD